MMIGLELCIGLIFKPLRHHVKTIVKEDPVILEALWVPALEVRKVILKEQPDDSAAKGDSPRSQIVKSTIELMMEHLRNVIVVLVSYGALTAESESADDLSSQTWAAISEMGFCKAFVGEWKQAAAVQAQADD